MGSMKPTPSPIFETGSTDYLSTATAWGAMRSLETFSQLVWGNPSAVPVGPCVWDSPLFAYRGLMLDTSRNYYEVEDILRTIEAMSANKLNGKSLLPRFLMDLT
ncbi:hypothetical protein COLO4_38208 [Corchorus olitorius]|uniref:beta-N-acetylhexosaminidase n=1 Tax=Corchorus olitorius TaxID=93759 RepID=A0A1R3FWE9_9ROSI|nr:hypothetical protein COLO4_38208 [Corchorus olitorius]